MGFVRDGGLDVLGLGGSQAAKAATAAAETQAQSGREAIAEERAARAQAQTFFEPFAGVAETGLEKASFLGDPQAQFDFLESNPLFQLALDNANQQTLQRSAAGGRLSAGDTLQDLSNNVLLSASPLIDRQRQDVTNLLNLGTGITESQANIAIGQGANVGNLLTDIGAAQAAGGVGAANAITAGNQNLASLGVGALAAFSDERLKTNTRVVGKYKDHNWFSWDWNELAGKLFNLHGSSQGVIAQEAKLINPEAVIMDSSGFYKVKYGEL